jgi:serine/threonine-protein kinase
MAAWICARVAEGAHSAHELVDESGAPLSVIHRDVNPTNIFLTHTGEVKLIDFGLARARVRVSKSADGIVKGKIPYLAPEQARGLPIDRRIDIYALGTTLWEMSTMKRLFKRENDIETLKAIRDAHVPDPREENPDFPEALWKIIDRALRRDRDERYATAEEMRTDLDAFARITAPHAPKVAAMISRLFPGGEARQAKWLRDAAAVRLPVDTMAPPAPVPIASSSLLSQREPHTVPAPPTEDPPGNEERERKAAAKNPSEAKEGPRSSRPSSKKSRSMPPAGAKPARRPSKPDGTTPAKRKKAKRPAPPEAPREDQRKLWMTVIVVVAVLFLLAMAASR